VFEYCEREQILGISVRDYGCCNFLEVTNGCYRDLMTLESFQFNLTCKNRQTIHRERSGS
jgi:hypothetical protein